ncbi:non-specific lipid transfer protein GPI-anchored 29-like [Aristolochia californica]|uniref:non-specific lipid transfer protein GPI-anchored 29-like n=1 Tax=Aristolochia californica TaxID=171875 RepID=UPI0035DFDEF1
MAWRVQKERIGLVLFFSAIVSAVIVGAQTTAPAPASQDCQTLAVNDLISCLDYVQPNSTAKAPAKDCCTGINEIFNSDPLCLCQLLLNSSSLGLEFNKTRALALPTVCKLNTPPVSICYTLLPPASAPLGAESPESGGVAGGPTTGGVVPGSGTSSPTGVTPIAAPPAEKSEGGTRLKHSASVILTGLSGAMIAIFL